MRNFKNALMPLMLIAMTSPAYAQFEKATTLLTKVSTWMKTAGVIVVTIAVMYVGFRMVFQAADWKDCAPVFWGGLLIGSAAVIAGAVTG